MSADIRIPQNTLVELRGVLVRALSRENLSVSDKIAIRKSHSSTALMTNYYAHNDGGKGDTFLKNLSEFFMQKIFL